MNRRNFIGRIAQAVGAVAVAPSGAILGQEEAEDGIPESAKAIKREIERNTEACASPCAVVYHEPGKGFPAPRYTIYSRRKNV